MGTSGEVSRAMILLLLLTCLAATSLAQERENPTWLIPSQEKPLSQDDQSFCEGELAQSSDTDLYQTRTSEILLPESFPPAVCIIFPFAPAQPGTRNLMDVTTTVGPRPSRSFSMERTASSELSVLRARTEYLLPCPELPWPVLKDAVSSSLTKKIKPN